MSDQDVSFRIERNQQGPQVVEVALFGIIDEAADLEFMRELHGRARLELADLRRINSHGVRTWMTAVATLPADADIELHNCPPPFVDQLNLVRGFCDRLRIVSFMAPYICEECEEECEQPVVAADCRRDRQLPRGLKCADCGGELVPNEVESIYLRFLEHNR